MTFTWRYERSDGTEVIDLPETATAEAFPSQSDAETWVGESWRDLIRDGIDAVTLLQDGAVVYGPMSLHPSS